MRIEPPPREATPSMWRLLIETATLRKSANIAPNLAGEWMRAEGIMPAKKYQISDAERAKRIREAAREHETSNDPKDFERAFGKVVKKTNQTKTSEGRSTKA